MRRPVRGIPSALIVACVLAVTARRVTAQERGGERASWAAGAMASAWSFTTALPHDSGTVSRVAQTTFPLTVTVPIGGRWTGDLSGAYTIGSARLIDRGGAERDVSLNGPTDVKLRLVGRLVGDALIVTAGVNAPTGLTKLGPDEVSALRLLGAPALDMPSPTLGNGLGVTFGSVVSRSVGGWAVAVGASYEARSAYSPVDVAAAGTVAVSDLNPSDAIHLTAGADRLIGPHRLSVLGSYDVYGADRLTFAGASGADASATFTLGPTMGLVAIMEFGVPGMQELSLSVVERYRSSFEGIDGQRAEGSSGNALAARVRAQWGSPGHRSLLLGGEARFQTGLAIDASLATAAISGVGGTVGVGLPVGSLTIAPSASIMVGKIDTGPVSTNATSLTASLSIGRR